MQTTISTTVALRDRLFSTEEEHALVGFLGGYTGLTRDAYALDLRQYVAWCAEHRVRLFAARRADIEAFGRRLEEQGRARATIARRLCTITCFYRYAEEEGLIAVSPAVHVRRPRLDYESHATGLDRNEVGAVLVAAGLASARDHALISLLALNGLRISEALGADIEALGLERGHRTLTILRKGGKVVTIPLAPRTARALDLAVGERCKGALFLGSDGERLDRHAASRIVRRIARRAGINKRVGWWERRWFWDGHGVRWGPPASVCSVDGTVSGLIIVHENDTLTKTCVLPFATGTVVTITASGTHYAGLASEQVTMSADTTRTYSFPGHSYPCNSGFSCLPADNPDPFP